MDVLVTKAVAFGWTSLLPSKPPFVIERGSGYWIFRFPTYRKILMIRLLSRVQKLRTWQRKTVDTLDKRTKLWSCNSKPMEGKYWQKENVRIWKKYHWVGFHISDHLNWFFYISVHPNWLTGFFTIYKNSFSGHSN